MINIELTDTPIKEDVQQIHDGLEQYNRQHTAPSTLQPLVIYLRDDDGTIKGGLTGGTFWHWCHVDILWLDESIRQHGYGSTLLQMVEEEAVRRGCVGIFLDTMSFQAPDFYIKHGYSEWGRLDDFPPGHQRIFFKKWLARDQQPER